MDYRYSMRNQPLLGSGGGPDYFEGIGHEGRPRGYSTAAEDDEKK